MSSNEFDFFTNEEVNNNCIVFKMDPSGRWIKIDRSKSQISEIRIDEEPKKRTMTAHISTSTTVFETSQALESSPALPFQNPSDKEATPVKVQDMEEVPQTADDRSAKDQEQVLKAELQDGSSVAEIDALMEGAQKVDSVQAESDDQVKQEIVDEPVAEENQEKAESRKREFEDESEVISSAADASEEPEVKKVKVDEDHTENSEKPAVEPTEDSEVVKRRDSEEPAADATDDAQDVKQNDNDDQTETEPVKCDVTVTVEPPSEDSPSEEVEVEDSVTTESDKTAEPQTDETSPAGESPKEDVPVEVEDSVETETSEPDPDIDEPLETPEQVTVDEPVPEDLTEDSEIQEEEPETELNHDDKDADVTEPQLTATDAQDRPVDAHSSSAPPNQAAGVPMVNGARNGQMNGFLDDAVEYELVEEYIDVDDYQDYEDYKLDKFVYFVHPSAEDFNDDKLKKEEDFVQVDRANKMLICKGIVIIATPDDIKNFASQTYSSPVLFCYFGQVIKGVCGAQPRGLSKPDFERILDLVK